MVPFKTVGCTIVSTDKQGVVYMLVISCIKQVPDTTQVKIDPATNTLIRDGIPFIINPYDSHALEESLRLKDRYNVRTVALSAAIKRLDTTEPVGIVFCGKQTIDGDTAQVGPGIASRLGFSQLTLVDRIESVDLVHKRIRVRRKLEGRHEIVEAPLPVMITVVRELNRPRYPVVAMRLDAEDKEIKVWDNSILKLDVETVGLKGSPTWVSKIFSPQRDQGEIIGDGLGNPDETAGLLLE